MKLVPLTEITDELDGNSLSPSTRTGHIHWQNIPAMEYTGM
jgi:hypothetical protein